MHLYIVRHASYFPKEVDPKEGLDNEGKTAIEHLAHYMHKAETHPRVIFHSPKERAKETAELLQFSVPKHELKTLNPLTPPKETLESIPKEVSSLILVGHRPNLQEIAKLFGYDIPFETASCAYFKDAILQWYITPEITKLSPE